MKKGRKAIKIKKNKKLLRYICWVIVPIIIAALIALDGLGVYEFTTERLIVLGIGLVVILLPFFSEITVKNFSVKRDKQ